MSPSRTDYGPGARFYDALAWLYSLGAIARAKRVHLGSVEPGQRVLYAGSGLGAEALRAAGQGARVTLLDSSPNMTAYARRRFERAGLGAEFVDARLADFAPAEKFDHVAAHFFLNVFASQEVAPALLGLADLLAPGGRLWVADFAAARGGAGLDVLRRLHYLPPLALFHLWARNPWHELYDYRERVDALGSRLRLVGETSVSVCGLPLYEVLSFGTAASADGAANA
ncbi:MAG TPA: class I SAM-dependent methyltransferase [Polyangiaceae bacterium]|nr:class I SAM-dependent methyltransferase [Polyangiaceae bacterium]